jgi:hypothetical protein
MIRFIRISYVLFTFALLLFVTSVYRVMSDLAHPSNHFRLVSIILFCLCSYFGYYSYKTLRADMLYARGPKLLDRHFNLKISRENSALLIGPISGQGRCQVRLHLERLATGSSVDEFVISTVASSGPHAESDLLPFTSDKARFEVNVSELLSWSFSIRLQPVETLNNTFIGRARLLVFGAASNIHTPEEIVTIA